MNAGLLVLGIDPGPTRCGWMLLRTQGGGAARYESGGTVASTAVYLTGLLNDVHAHVIAVERPRFHAIKGASPLTMRAMASQLIETTYVAARIIQMAKDCDDPVVMEMPAGTWRRGLLGKGASTNAAIKRALGPLLRLPEKTNEHMRDAGGVALAAVRLLANRSRIEGGIDGRSPFDADAR